MHGNLFIRTPNNIDLRSFAATVFSLLNVANASTRESENYADGEYVTGQVLGLMVKVAIADDSEFPDYQFWLNFKPINAWGEESSSFDGLADVVAKRLALEGYEVARALAFGRVGGATMLYTRKSTEGSVRDRLEIRRVG
jgi:hypothetical protein